MKIGIITLTGINYGNRLQNYAVQEIITKLGYDVKTFHNPFFPGFNQYIHIIKKLVKKVFFFYKYRADLDRETRFGEFDKKYIRYSKFWLNKKNHRIKIAKQFDCLICGSDQVWNPSTQNYGYNNFGMFAEQAKRISLAASFGVDKFPETRRTEFSSYIKGFYRISVREESGAEIVRSLVNKNVETIIDPTLMIDGSDWLKLAKKPSWLGEGEYVLEYILGNRDEELNDIRRYIEMNKKVYIKLMDRSILEYYTIDPGEFIYLIYHCKAMITDSYHGAIFSFIFDKPLMIFERIDQYESMHTRLYNLLKNLHLEDRLRHNMENYKMQIFTCDYSIGKENLCKEKNKFNTFIQEALGLNYYESDRNVS
jgi:hypothetical protein